MKLAKIYNIWKLNRKVILFLFSAGTSFSSPFKTAVENNLSFWWCYYKVYQKVFNAPTELGFSFISLSKGLPIHSSFMLERVVSTDLKG